MFHTYTNVKNDFSIWYKETNKLNLQEFLECGGKIENYLPVYIDRHSLDNYLLFVTDEAGICGSAILSPLYLEASEQFSNQYFNAPVWCLRNIIFHIQNTNLILKNDLKFDRIVGEFYLKLFEKLWNLSESFDSSTAYVINSCLQNYEDLKFFGGFKFRTEYIESKDFAVAVLDIDKITYDSYLTIKQRYAKLFLPSEN